MKGQPSISLRFDFSNSSSERIPSSLSSAKSRSSNGFGTGPPPRGLLEVRYHLDRVEEGIATPEEAKRLDDERAERRKLEQRIADLERVVPFEDEGKQAKRSSFVAFIAGVLIVLIVLGVVVWDWVEGDEGEEVTTGVGLARLGAVLAAFYVAGQLFRRSTSLQFRAQEFERTAIAMKVAADLAQQIEDPERRDVFIMQIYMAHLTTPTQRSEDGKSASMDVNALIDSYNKMRSGS